MSNLVKLAEIDCIFLSYDEPNAEKNYADLMSKAPWAMRVHGVKGSDAAHKACADLSTTERFITVDGDNIVDPLFFDQIIDLTQWKSLNETQLSWCGRNNINGLIYGNGGLKCWTREHVWQMRTHESANDDTNQVDFCWNTNYQHLHECYSVTHNNANAMQAWRAGFREGVKMCLKDGLRVPLNRFNHAINGWNRQRLAVWMSVGADVIYGQWAIYGARLGCYMTMLTDWDFTQVKDFEYLNALFKEQESKYIADESLRLGHIIREKLQITIADLDEESSKFFKGNYNPLPRTAAEPWGYKTQVDIVDFELMDDLDVIFLSNGEADADVNFAHLQKICPRAKRVSGVKGIYAAHREAAKTSSTDFFFVVDADAWVVDDFQFHVRASEVAENMVCIWPSLNPVNNLVYGYGGIKLFSKQMFAKEYDTLVDMTTTLAKYVRVEQKLSCITMFNTSEFDAWRSAFRECVKLSSKVISGQSDNETEYRLNTWTTVGASSAYGAFTIAGALAGKVYGTEHASDPVALSQINNYDFLYELFLKQKSEIQ